MDLKVTETLVQALLSEAKEKGIDGLTLTTLVKLIYLADVYYARQQEGKTYTGIQWNCLGCLF
jgi:hypothetical protein